MLALNLGHRFQVPSTSVRYTYVQGPRNSFYNAYSGICRIFTLRILNGLAPVIYEDGKQLRDFLDVSDVARANVLLMESPEADYRVFNVGPGRATTVLDFARLVLRVAGSDLQPVVSGQFRVRDTRHTATDIGSLSAFDWSAEIPLERTTERYTEWISPFHDMREYLDAA